MSLDQNSIIEILDDYLVWEEKKAEKKYDQLSSKEKDELRLKYDNDAKYYKSQINKDTGVKYTDEEALFADTIISFWTPYKRLLELEAEWNVYKTAKSLKALLWQIKSNKETAYSQRIKDVNLKLNTFAKLCYTAGNFMLLPNRQMNNQRYKFTTDRIDMTLYECFGKGVLSGFFENEKELVDWIVVQNLSSVFIGGDICREKIEWFVREDKPKLISQMNADEIFEYIDNSISFIESRNTLLANF